VDNKGIGIAILIGLGLLGLWFFTRKTGPLLPSPAPNGGNGYVGQPLKLMPAGSSANSTAGMLHYKNRETRDIVWNEDMIPTRIVIEREYYQLP